MARAARAGRRALLTAVALGFILLGPAGAIPETPQPGVSPGPALLGADPNPVLLVPGWSDDQMELQVLRQRLIQAGWDERAVVTLQFEDPVGSNVDHALEVARAIQELRARSGSPEVDIVAHSMGGLAVRHYLLFNGGGLFANRVVFLGTPHRGTVAAHLAWGEGGEEMVPGSAFLDTLNEKGTVPEGVRVLNVRTRLDLRVLPMSSATLPGATDVEVCCPTHAGLLQDPEAFEAIRAFLGRG